MNIIYLLIPLALIIAGLLIWLFMWAIKSNQFDDLEGPAYRILMDDDQPQAQKDTSKKDKKTKTSNKEPEKTSEQLSEQLSENRSKQTSDKSSD